MKSILEKEKNTSARLRVAIHAHQEAEEKLRELNATLERRVASRTKLAETRAKKLRELASQVIEAEERERQRIAQILHDDLQQLIAAARIQVDAFANQYGSSSELVNIRLLMSESIDKSRHLAHELSPPGLHGAGLPATLKWLVKRMNDQFGLSVDLETPTDLQIESEPLKGFIFRAVQEILFNVVKHAGVSSAELTLVLRDDEVSATVRDYGKGFDPAAVSTTSDNVGLGLLSISEIAGHFGGNLSIRSSPGHGSCFTLTIPLGTTTAL